MIDSLASLWYGFSHARDYVIYSNGTVVIKKCSREVVDEDGISRYLDEVDNMLFDAALRLAQKSSITCRQVVITELFGFTYFEDGHDLVCLDVTPDADTAYENLKRDVCEGEPYMAKINGNIYVFM